MNSSTNKKQKIVRQAIANERLEGLRVSVESQKIADTYVVGKVTSKVAAKKIRARYGVL